MAEQPSLQDLHYFLVVAQQGSLARASEQLDLSTAALSKAMKRLEAVAGARLFKRTARSIHLSEAGMLMCEQAEKILRQWDDSKQALADLTDQVRGTVVISASAAFARLKLLPLVPEFKKHYPDIVLDLRLEDRFVDLKREETDLLIRVGLLDDEDIIARPLMPLDMVYGASPVYLKKHGMPDSPQALREHKTIGFRLPANGQFLPWQFFQANHIFTLELAHHMVVNSPDAIQDLILLDEGIGLLNRHLAAPLIEQGQLVPVLENWMPPNERGIYLCYLDREWMPTKQKAVIDFLMSALTH